VHFLYSQNNKPKINAPPMAHPIAPPAITPALALDKRTEGEFDSDNAGVDVEANVDVNEVDADVEVKDAEAVELDPTARLDAATGSKSSPVFVRFI